jgi:hypothetical protein
MNNIEKDLIYTIKIANGDEVVTKVVDIDEDGNYIISKPLTVVPGPQGIQMIMSLFTANPDKNYQLNKSQCSMIALSRDEVRDSYVEATTGIKPVTNKILMG